MVVLGSTGSIGVNTLKIAKKFNLEVEVLVAGNNYKLLNRQIKEFKPKYVVVKDKNTAEKVDFKNVLYGEEVVLEVLEKAKSDLVVNALVGEAGLKPTLKTQELNKKLALANKESLVIAGKFIDTSKIKPIDSEHFGIWYLLNGKWRMENGKLDSEKCKVKSEKFRKLYITASGGALRDWPRENIKNAQLKDVLKHPNWSMGKKITIDSATMVNKLFELLEAKWLFNTNSIDAFIETKSVIHALVEWTDGSTTAHISKTDMKLPISFAILNEVKEEILEPVNLLDVGNLEFRKIKTSRYPVWEIKEILLNNSDLGIVINTANEFAIDRFLREEIGFLDISKIILKAIKKFENIKTNKIDEIFEIKKEVREWCESDFV
jgi:1-deoxy-D-xylulose-5-phosphate reductoisomerase